MTNEIFLTVLALGFALGLRHALDPDHLVAVSTIVGECRSVKRSSLVGMFWGLGHTASLLVVGTSIIILKLQIPERVALWMEFGVAVMLVLLGAKVLTRFMRKWKLHIHKHAHDGGHRHVHFHLHRQGEAHTHQHRHLITFGARPFLVGMVHGLAGSAALTLLVLATIPSAIAALIYIGVFGLGSVAAMFLMSGLMSLPFILSGKRFNLVSEGLKLVTGLLSVGFGLLLIWQYGFREHLVY
jgi:ABC-type nickel/cobalt efflux system permease component RcnA